MRVLLLYPEFPDTFWSFKHALHFIRKKATFPPLGLITIAALLPADPKLADGVAARLRLSAVQRKHLVRLADRLSTVGEKVGDFGVTLPKHKYISADAAAAFGVPTEVPTVEASAAEFSGVAASFEASTSAGTPLFVA